MKTIVRKDEQAVSPVIATILMVAITVVLAAVLYVMVSGLITGPGNAPKQIGATMTRSGDGTNWVITFTSVPTGMTAGQVSISISYPSGAVDVAALPLSSGNTTISYHPATGGTPSTTTALSAADTILLSTTAYLSGYKVTLTSSGSIVYGPQTLQ